MPKRLGSKLTDTDKRKHTGMETELKHIYEYGATAFRDGQPEDACPYPPSGGTSAKRTIWFNGYFDSRTGSRLKHAFDALGIQWP